MLLAQAGRATPMAIGRPMAVSRVAVTLVPLPSMVAGLLGAQRILLVDTPVPKRVLVPIQYQPMEELIVWVRPRSRIQILLVLRQYSTARVVRPQTSTVTRRLIRVLPTAVIRITYRILVTPAVLRGRISRGIKRAVMPMRRTARVVRLATLTTSPRSIQTVAIVTTHLIRSSTGTSLLSPAPTVVPTAAESAHAMHRRPRHLSLSRQLR